MTFELNFHHAYGGPVGTASFRNSPEDFVVDEDLGFTPEGEGEHVYLHLRKRGTNTEWLAEQIARFASVAAHDVSFCGQKDRHAVTSQWFSIYMPKKPQPDWQFLPQAIGAEVNLLAVTRGLKKLRRGQHASNAFCIVLRDLVANRGELEARLEKIKATGVPNYFGEQRFGLGGSNLQMANSWLAGGRPIRSKGQKGRAMSAARSYLFNLVLSERVKNQTWNQMVAGDVASDLGLPTAPLWGRGQSRATDEAAQSEQAALNGLAAWKNGLEHCGLNQERRPLVLMPGNLQWQLGDDGLELQFHLPPGQFATALMREIVELRNASQAAGEPE